MELRTAVSRGRVAHARAGTTTPISRSLPATDSDRRTGAQSRRGATAVPTRAGPPRRDAYRRTRGTSVRVRRAVAPCDSARSAPSIARLIPSSHRRRARRRARSSADLAVRRMHAHPGIEHVDRRLQSSRGDHDVRAVTRELARRCLPGWISDRRRSWCRRAAGRRQFDDARRRIGRDDARQASGAWPRGVGRDGEDASRRLVAPLGRAPAVGAGACLRLAAVLLSAPGAVVATLARAGFDAPALAPAAPDAANRRVASRSKAPRPRQRRPGNT